MKFVKWTLLAACLALVISMAACSSQETPSQVSSTAPTAAPSSSEPESSASSFVPAEDLIPSQSPTSGQEDFQTAFSQNPIDKAYDKEYSLAASFSMMLSACDTAAKQWKDMVDVSYQAAMEVTAGKDREKLMEEQNQWADELDGKIEEIRAKADESNDAAIKAAQDTVLLYRDRAMALCHIKFKADGTLPAFESASPGETSAVG